MKANTKFTEILNASQIATIAVGLLYVSGYYINSIFVRNYGISETELLRLEYIKIGFVFFLITLGFVFLPLGAFRLTYNVRKASGLPHYHLGAIGNALNTILFLGFPLFLAFFATRYEWELPLPVNILGITTFKGVMILFLIISSIGVIVVPYIERVIDKKTSNQRKISVFRFIIEPIRYGIFVSSVILVGGAIYQIPWISALFSKGIYYALAGVVFVVGMTAATLWVKKIQNIEGTSFVYPLISFGIAILYYMAVTSYVFGVYTFIPCNRGGRLPVVEAYLQFKEDQQLFSNPINKNGVMLRGPAYIIEETTDRYFIASENMGSWLTDFVPIHVIRKDNIPYLHMQRITDGFPRIKRE